MQINSNNEITKINPALNNKNAEKPSSENKNDKVSGYAEKQAAPANSNYYMAMYGVKNAKTEEKAEAKTQAADDEKYRKAMGEYLEKWGSPEQLKEFYGEAEEKTEAQPTAEDDAKYRKAMGEYLEKWGSLEQLKEFYGEKEDFSKYKVDVNVEDIKFDVPKEETKSPKFEYKSETAESDDDAKYRKAMGEYLEKWGSPEQLKEFYGEADKKVTTSTPTSELPSPDEVKFASEEDKKYYEQYLEYKHKYE